MSSTNLPRYVHLYLIVIIIIIHIVNIIIMIIEIIAFVVDDDEKGSLPLPIVQFFEHCSKGGGIYALF